MPSQKQNLSFPGLAKSIMRPVIKTARFVVSKGEKVTKDVARMTKGAVKNTITGTTKVASGVVKGSSRIINDVTGSKRTRKPVKKSVKSKKS
jgi:hypothetical protein